MKDKQYYVNQLVAIGFSEEQAIKDVDKSFVTCKNFGIDFHSAFMVSINTIKPTIATKEELKQLIELEYQEESPIKPKFIGYHGSKRKDLRKLHK